MNEEFAAFKDAVWSHYRAEGRGFPWRDTENPYEILVSEFMLQQTQTERVVPKYLAWLDRFPTVESVAKASLADVLGLWVGLGYNRRARFLRDACISLNGDYSSIIPQDPEELRRLPGIGPYTAAAVSTFAYNRPNVFIETNIRSVFIHFFFQNQTDIRDSAILELVGKTLDADDPRHWYYALMDYGANLKRRFSNPNRASAHYARQAGFAGSNREARGAILRHLRFGTAAAPGAIAASECIEEERIIRALEGLVKEGLVAEKGGKYGLP